MSKKVAKNSKSDDSIDFYSFSELVFKDSIDLQKILIKMNFLNSRSIFNIISQNNSKEVLNYITSISSIANEQNINLTNEQFIKTILNYKQNIEEFIKLFSLVFNFKQKDIQDTKLNKNNNDNLIISDDKTDEISIEESNSNEKISNLKEP